MEILGQLPTACNYRSSPSLDGRGRSCALVLLVWLTAAVDLAVGAHHQASAPAPAVDCSSALLGLFDCLTFVEERSTEVKSQKGCCARLKKVVKGGQVSCLCYAFKQGASFGVKLNMTKALALPSACRISTPHLSNCNIVLPGSPGATPGMCYEVLR
ncbi:non-specific lipid-transfer protein-like protein [Canna indica]|uniref:Non-specific lipid-transfer protein-like protein n=1 Tax=Canna indica TaxID=4628 RepID=A0AAQ3KP91_9LILI|nr:non-specific lipid-transfer protein-like protein [Canna indica]